MRMKKFFALVIASTASCFAYAQENSLPLDLLKAPASPAFILLDKEPTEIERPVTPTDFMVSLQNASDNFSALPKNYSLEFAPFWIFGAKNISFSDLTDTTGNIINTFTQSFLVSLAVSSDEEDVTQKTQLALGIKFSLLRGNKINSEFLEANRQRVQILSRINDEVSLNEKVTAIHNKYKNLILSDTLGNAEQYAALEEIEINQVKNNLLLEKSEKLKQYEKALEKLSETKLQRKGWFLDCAGGFVTDFPGGVFDNAVVPKVGAWINFGNEGQKNFAAILLVRGVYTVNEMYLTQDVTLTTANLFHADAGLRFILDKNKFSFSMEGLARMTSGANNIISENKNAWKIMLSTSYDLGNNKILTFNFGRDFDGTIAKDGSLVAALNLVMGFGSKRNIE